MSVNATTPRLAMDVRALDQSNTAAASQQERIERISKIVKIVLLVLAVVAWVAISALVGIAGVNLLASAANDSLGRVFSRAFSRL